MFDSELFTLVIYLFAKQNNENNENKSILSYFNGCVFHSNP
jgi:hypothetical protein